MTDATFDKDTVAGDTLTVVAVTFSPGSSLTSFLDSLALATDREVEVLLADNGSSDGAPEAAARRPGVRLISTGGNLGYGGGVNAGVAATGAEWVVAANPDVVWDPGSIDVLLAAAERWPRAGALGPLIRQPDGGVYPSARALPTLGRGIGHAVFGWFWPGNPWSTRYRRENEQPAERTAGWLSGSCLLLRRQAFESVGGFDPAYFMYFEDVDLGERLADAGWLNVYVPSAAVTHTGAHATSRNPSAMTSAHHRSAWLYFSRHYSGLRWLPLRLVIRLGLAVREQLSLRIAGVSAGARPHGKQRRRSDGEVRTGNAASAASAASGDNAVSADKGDVG
ncbi:MAG TPA: glycosyltransferase family 2 protein [Jatrophihabitans sp.]|uniref:glycosyltransferase family 2 protein n=1 Tax=Jatrophihabitans sp. TaxID=1932789 RepID=UPI002EF1CE9D